MNTVIAPDDRKTERITIVLPRFLFDRIQKEKQDRLTSYSAIVREMLVECYRAKDNKIQQS